MFLILSWDDKEVFRVTVKLPLSRRYALTLPYVAPTGYGLGKSGWVTAEFQSGADVPVDMFEQWIDESYRDRAEEDRCPTRRKVAERDSGSRGKAASGPVQNKKIATSATTAHKSNRISSSLRRKPRRS